MWLPAVALFALVGGLAAPVLFAWQRHLAGQGAHQNALWTVLMYLAWLEK